MKPKKKKYPKLSPREKELASGFIAEEIEAGQYPQEQAVAIGISRARRAGKRLEPKHKSVPSPRRSKTACLIEHYQ
jgi:hypothetical protein